jgi:hypothetical protein
MSYLKRQGPLRKVVTAGARVGAFACPRADLGQFQPITAYCFPFSFSARIREFIKNCREMLKI